MSSAWLWAVKRYTDKRLFASRDILAEEDEIQPNGKLFRKLGMCSSFLFGLDYIDIVDSVSDIDYDIDYDVDCHINWFIDDDLDQYRIFVHSTNVLPLVL